MPMLTRLMGDDAIHAAKSSVMSSGLHSMVHSVISSWGKCLSTASTTISSASVLSDDGVPPPKYMVYGGE